MATKIQSRGSFPGLSRAQEMDLQHSIKRANRMSVAEAEKERVLRKSMADLRKNYPHTSGVKANRLMWYLVKVGHEKVVEVAANNLSTFHFREKMERLLAEKS